MIYFTFQDISVVLFSVATAYSFV